MQTLITPRLRRSALPAPLPLALVALAGLAVPVGSQAGAQGVSDLAERWSAPLGGGFSGPAVADGRIFVCDRAPGSDASGVVAHDLASGARLWRTPFPDAPHDTQENYGGGTGPHATPQVHGDAVLALGFAGRLVCLAAADGAERWSLDLVEEEGAIPVQFGFAGAPVVEAGRVFVPSGGAAGVLALDLEDGDVLWRSEAAAASYVTPRLVRFDGTQQLVVLQRDDTVGLDPETGATLWRVPHLRPELTNFAMLTVLPAKDGGAAGLVASGQGLRGARRIDVARQGAGWEAAPTWHARSAQFSHGQVLLEGDTLYGSNGSLLCALDVETGALVFKLRAFGEANWVGAGGTALQLAETGEVVRARLTRERIEVLARREVLAPTAWAPPTLASIDGARVLVLRDAERLVVLDVDEPSPAEPLEVFPTGYESDRVQVPPALLAFAAGDYGPGDYGPGDYGPGDYAPGGEDEASVWSLRDVAGALWLDRGDGAPARAFEPRSDSEFVSSAGARLTLERGEESEPTALVWTPADGAREVRAVRRALVPLPWSEVPVERFAGSWRVADALDLELVASEDGSTWTATSSAYPDVQFRVQAVGPERLRLEALDAPYGIPPILLDWAPMANGTPALRAHQGTDTAPAVRS